MRIPKYRKASGRDLGCGEFNHVKTYFPGPYNSYQSREAYRTWLRDVVMADAAAVSVVAGPFELADLVSQFLDWAETYYERGEYDNCRYALLPLAEAYGSLLAEDFGPKRLKEWMAALVKKGQARGYINSQRRKILRMFNWAGEEELLSGSIAQSIMCVKGLRAGRTTAREPEKKPRLELEWVEAARDALPSAHLRDMLQVQWYTLVRSDSLVNAESGQFETIGSELFWRPKHKTQKAGGVLVVPVGPKCRAILAPYLAAAVDPGAALWSPRMVSDNLMYRERYDTHSWGQVVGRAQDHVNEQRAKKGLDLFPHWSPHRIRHSRGQEIRETYGAEAAQAMLGHASLTATQVYTSKRLGLAKQVAHDLG